MPYGSIPFVTFETKLLNVLRDEAYRASIELAKEKGAFKLFDPERYLASGHNKKLPDDIRDGIRKYGIRNSHLTSIAPTGTISFSADNMSGGIEPVFALETERPVDMPGGKQVVTVKDYGFNFLGVSGRTTAQGHYRRAHGRLPCGCHPSRLCRQQDRECGQAREVRRLHGHLPDGLRRGCQGPHNVQQGTASALPCSRTRMGTTALLRPLSAPQTSPDASHHGGLDLHLRSGDRQAQLRIDAVAYISAIYVIAYSRSDVDR
jgi:hypothetical protein